VTSAISRPVGRTIQSLLLAAAVRGAPQSYPAAQRRSCSPDEGARGIASLCSRPPPARPLRPTGTVSRRSSDRGPPRTSPEPTARHAPPHRRPSRDTWNTPILSRRLQMFSGPPAIPAAQWFRKGPPHPFLSPGQQLSFRAQTAAVTAPARAPSAAPSPGRTVRAWLVAAAPTGFMFCQSGDTPLSISAPQSRAPVAELAASQRPRFSKHPTQLGMKLTCPGRQYGIRSRPSRPPAGCDPAAARPSLFAALAPARHQTGPPAGGSFRKRRAARAPRGTTAAKTPRSPRPCQGLRGNQARRKTKNADVFSAAPVRARVYQRATGAKPMAIE